MKTCTRCGVAKPLEEFYKRKQNRDGLRSDCKTCVTAENQQWRKANSEKVKEGNHRYNTSESRRASNQKYFSGGRDPRKPWPDNEITYTSAHLRVTATYGPAKNHLCVDCGGTAKHWSYIGGCPNELIGKANDKGDILAYSTDPSYYVARCVPCHKQYDS